MDGTPRRRSNRTTGPSRSGSGARAGRGGSASRAARPARRAPADPTPGGPVGAGWDVEDLEHSGTEGSGASRHADGPARVAGGRSVGGRSGRNSGSRPAGTRPGTAPSASASSGGRRIGRLTARTAPTVARTARATSQLIRQIAVLGLVFCAVALALAVPLRNYLAQRADLAVEMGRQQQLEISLAALDQEQAALADPAYIAAQAKRRLQYVAPGVTVYAVHAPALPVPKATAARSVAPAVPWYSHLWDTLSDPTGTAAPSPAHTAAPSPAQTAAPSPARAGR